MISINSKLLIFCSGLLTSIVLADTAQAANLSFTPVGSQLDKDDILDIQIAPGKIIDFRVTLDTTGLTGTISSFGYTFNYDSSELGFPRIAGMVQNGSGGGELNTFIALQSNLSIGPGLKTLITTIRFTVVNPGLRSHDGKFDFQIEKAGGTFTNNSSIPNVFDYGPNQDPFSQEVEVQKAPEPTSTLGLLALGTLGAGATLKRKLKPSKLTEKETLKVG